MSRDQPTETKYASLAKWMCVSALTCARQQTSHGTQRRAHIGGASGRERSRGMRRWRWYQLWRYGMGLVVDAGS